MVNIAQKFLIGAALFIVVFIYKLSANAAVWLPKKEEIDWYLEGSYSYYSNAIQRSFDLQHISIPGYNASRADITADLHKIMGKTNIILGLTDRVALQAGITYIGNHFADIKLLLDQNLQYTHPGKNLPNLEVELDISSYLLDRENHKVTATLGVLIETVPHIHPKNINKLIQTKNLKKSSSTTNFESTIFGLGTAFNTHIQTLPIHVSLEGTAQYHIPADIFEKIVRLSVVFKATPKFELLSELQGNFDRPTPEGYLKNTLNAAGGDTYMKVLGYNILVADIDQALNLQKEGHGKDEASKYAVATLGLGYRFSPSCMFTAKINKDLTHESGYSISSGLKLTFCKACT